MKKKNGFTLAEVLVTLAIIGVVAALAAPALSSNVQKAKVAPSIRKFMSTMENANEHILAENDEDKLSAVVTDADKYYEALNKYVKGSKSDNIKNYKLYQYDGQDYSGYGENGVATYKLSTDDAFYFSGPIATAPNPGTSYKGAIYNLVYDNNGFDAKPNRFGKDIFAFYVDENGAIVPVGGRSCYQAYGNATGDVEQEWKNDCEKSGYSCAGSVEDNNWKVVYKY